MITCSFTLNPKLQLQPRALSVNLCDYLQVHLAISGFGFRVSGLHLDAVLDAGAIGGEACRLDHGLDEEVHEPVVRGFRLAAP